MYNSLWQVKLLVWKTGMSLAIRIKSCPVWSVNQRLTFYSTDVQSFSIKLQETVSKRVWHLVKISNSECHHGVHWHPLSLVFSVKNINSMTWSIFQHIPMWFLYTNKCFWKPRIQTKVLIWREKVKITGPAFISSLLFSPYNWITNYSGIYMYIYCPLTNLCTFIKHGKL